MAQAQRARITNISDGHIGFSKPTSIFLRRRQHKPDHLRWANIGVDQIDDAMRKMEAEGKIRIELIDADSNIIEEAEKEVVEIDENGDVVKVKDEKTESKEVEVTENVKPAKEKVMVALVEPPEKEHIPTVGSDEDGNPQLQNIEQGDPPSEPAEDDEETKDLEEGAEPEPKKETEPKEESAKAEAPTTEYSRKDLKKMNLRQVRKILEDREIEIDSTHKEVLIEAILDRQIMAGA